MSPIYSRKILIFGFNNQSIEKDLKSAHMSSLRPKSKSELFWAFTWLALQGFGGVLPVAQRELVEKRHWFTNEEFLEEWAVAQVLPGPNVVNLSIIYGAKQFGLIGALVATAGMLVLPIMALIVIAIVYLNFGQYAVASGVLRGMGAVAAGLIAGACLKLAGALKTHPLGKWQAYAIAVACFLLVGIVRVPLVYVLLTLGVFSIVVTYRQIKKVALESQDV